MLRFHFLILLGAMAFQPVHAADAGDVLLEGDIVTKDAGQYRMLPFDVPAGTRRIGVELAYSGRERGILLTLGIFDPLMFRGSGRLTFTLAESDATPPFNPGPLPPGRWNLLLGIGQVPTNQSSHYTARIRFQTTVDDTPKIVIRQGAGWYRGDLHSHTGHSDGVCFSQGGKNVPCPAHKLIETAAAQHLDFLAVTDHNTSSTYNQLREMQPYFDRLLLINGREMTTFQGHANVWGTQSFIDYRIGFEGFTINDFLDQVHKAHALISINHAYWPTDEHCPGCGWGWKGQTDFSRVDAIEAINGYHERGSWFQPPPGNGIPFWEEQVAKGFRITAVGGGDDHRSGEQLSSLDGVGIPTTVVYAQELSQKAILAGIKAGHVYIKTVGPGGPDLFLTQGNNIAGDAIAVSSAMKVSFGLRVAGGNGMKASLLLDGKPVKSASWSVEKADQEFAMPMALDAGRHWVRAVLESASGELAALTNPIYVNYAAPPQH